MLRFKIQYDKVQNERLKHETFEFYQFLEDLLRKDNFIQIMITETSKLKFYYDFNTNIKKSFQDFNEYPSELGPKE